MRAHFTRPVTDQQGNLLPNVQVSVYEPGTTNLILDDLYIDGTSSNVMNNPFVSSTGIIDIYLDEPKRVDLGLIQGGLPVQTYADVDVLAAGADSLHSGDGLDSLVIGLNATSPGVNSVALGPGASAGGIQSTAVGSSANALGDQSIALGAAAAQGTGSISLGNGAAATGVNSVALGTGSTTGMDTSVALGNAAVANFSNSSAIGPGAQTTDSDQIMLGTGTGYVEIPSGACLVMTSSGGFRYQLTIDDDGSLDTIAFGGV